MRIVPASLALFCLTSAVSAQEETALPANLAAVELERSRTCVDVFARLDALDQELAPLAERSQRLLAIAESIALEDDRILEILDDEDLLELQVREWFASDQELAQRYVATLAEELIDQRSAAREAIREAVATELNEVQQEANDVIAATGDLDQRAGPCDGAIFVRSAVLEACATSSGPLCEQAELPASEVVGFRFVDSPEAVWDIQEVRPWSNPTPLFATPDGQLDGARTLSVSRSGNTAVSVAFSPLLRPKSDMTPEETAQYQSTNDSLGFQFEHPDLAFTPALGFRATLEQPLGGEASYVLHFGPLSEDDVLWTGAAGTGAPFEETLPLGAAHVGKLQAGAIIALTALRTSASGEDEPVFTIELTDANQAAASRALLAYMAEGLGRDLIAIAVPRGGE